MDRYSRNLSSISHDENLVLQSSKVCVMGCGGLGGHIIEMLGRLGIGHITAVDSDVFEVSNLNRQLFSDEMSIGKSKALMAVERMKVVNSNIEVIPVTQYIDKTNAKEILGGHELVIDALDNIESRLVLEKACKDLNIPLVHGAIAGWYGQVCTIFPGENTLSKIYSSGISKGMEKRLGNPSFTPALVASMEVSEAVKILLGKGELLRNKLLFLDLLSNEFVIIEL